MLRWSRKDGLSPAMMCCYSGERELLQVRTLMLVVVVLLLLVLLLLLLPSLSLLLTLSNHGCCS